MNRDQLKAKLQEAQIQRLSSSNKNPYPSAMQMARNLGGSIINNAMSITAGNSLRVDDSAAQARLNTCKGCEFFNQLQERCTKCGCNMAVKTYLRAEKCPVGKW
jgi:hypothetical protein